jgi:hypothetical protein
LADRASRPKPPFCGRFGLAKAAKVTIDDPNTLPAKLKLAFTRDPRTGRTCEVVWRRGKALGIKFVR